MGKMADRFKIKQERRNSSNGQSVTQKAIVRPELNHIIRSTAMAARDSGVGVSNVTSREPNLENMHEFEWPRRDAVGPLEGWEIDNAFRKHKYIAFLHPQLGPVAITFPAWNVHADMYRAYRRFPLISAGFYDLFVRDDEVKISVGGRSESLDCDSRPELDKELIAKALGLEEQWV